ncbi:MAG TPA: hypothetical protein VGM50_14870 [Gemmatimonadaceae bacterium]
MRKLVLTLAAASPLIAPLAAQTPAVRLINAPDASTQPAFTFVAAVRQLPGGQLLVNDVVKRQLTLVDPSFAKLALVADSAAGSANSYGTRAGGLIPYVGDSTLFVDPADLSMFVIDPHGAIARVASVPRSQDAALIGNNTVGSPGIDASGRLVYRGGAVRNFGGIAAMAKGGTIPDPPDTAALVRVDMATRKLDTAAFYKIPRVKMNVQQTEHGITASSEINPMPTVDDWSVLSDGTIAVARGQDYHVDFIDNDGTLRSGAKVPFDWQKLTDEDKVAVLDSAKTAFERARASATSNGNGQVVMGPPGGGGGVAGAVVMMRVEGGAGGGAPRVMSNDGAGGMPAVQFVSANDLPDYRPAFSQGATRADLDGNLWIRTSATRNGSAGFIYDVVDRSGKLVDRIQIPAGRQIVGFGKGGVVYMAARDERGSWLERTHR